MTRHVDLTRDQQLADAVKLVHGLLGERPANEVQVEVTRGGTFKVTAKAGEGGVKRHEWKPR